MISVLNYVTEGDVGLNLPEKEPIEKVSLISGSVDTDHSTVEVYRIHYIDLIINSLRLFNCFNFNHSSHHLFFWYDQIGTMSLTSDQTLIPNKSAIENPEESVEIAPISEAFVFGTDQSNDSIEVYCQSN